VVDGGIRAVGEPRGGRAKLTGVVAEPNDGRWWLSLVRCSHGLGWTASASLRGLLVGTVA
jgi:hypothetical protein